MATANNLKTYYTAITRTISQPFWRHLQVERREGPSSGSLAADAPQRLESRIPRKRGGLLATQEAVVAGTRPFFLWFYTVLSLKV